MQTMKEASTTIWVGNETTTIGATLSDSEINTALIGALIGGTSGSLLVILLALFLPLALLWVIRKRRRCVNETESYNHHHRQTQIEGNNGVRTLHMEEEGDQSIEVNNNCAYDKLDSLIPTVAYNSDKHVSE
jgi:ABC-type bacteriocin/lantibiotic exporter with double-glycine peptidase domain